MNKNCKIIDILGGVSVEKDSVCIAFNQLYVCFWM